MCTILACGPASYTRTSRASSTTHLGEQDGLFPASKPYHYMPPLAGEMTAMTHLLTLVSMEYTYKLNGSNELPFSMYMSTRRQAAMNLRVLRAITRPHFTRRLAAIQCTVHTSNIGCVINGVENLSILYRNASA
ncbi:hypothetical protein M413DRAFT_440270 [Hebeloma cylindrosporum]|uniref:Uncharacterized protein n=1 Tax=Hebeloma cylindrosporum TaxID=76867 RepID=A0A0C3CS28_HEBCY|nr:hypothetical protein M413DRAFT_440270 [Hebeloma cylindrosporum h7]